MTEMERLAFRYVSGRAARGELTKGSAKLYRGVLWGFCQMYGARPVKMIGRAHMERWLESKQHLAVSTRRAYFAAAATFCEWLVVNDYIKRDPMRDLKPPPRPRAVPRALTYDGVAQLLAACPDTRARAITWLMVGMGLRRAEVATLQMSDWDRRRRLLTVHGKGGHERALPVPEQVAAALSAYVAECEFPESYGVALIRSHTQPYKGISPSAVGDLMTQWLYAAGVKRRPRDRVSGHALRHTAASDVLDRCGDVRIVQEMLGHQSLDTTRVYLRRASLGRLRNAMDGRDYMPGSNAAADSDAS